jgi:hypothetical protein
MTIKATIVVNGTAVAGARLCASPRRPRTILPFENIAYSAESDVDGIATAAITFRRGQSEESVYGIAAYHPEYGSAYTERELGELTENDPFTGLILELEPGHTIVGRVVDSSDNPIPGAVVTLYTMCPTGGISMSSLSVPTTLDGSFAMAGIRFDNTPNQITVAYRLPVVSRQEGRRFGRPHKARTVSSESTIRELFDTSSDVIEIPRIRLPVNVLDHAHLSEDDQG